MIATQRLIYGYVPLCTCVLDILYLRQIFPLSCSYISTLLYIKSFSFLLPHIVMDGLKRRKYRYQFSSVSPVLKSVRSLQLKSFEIAAYLLGQSVISDVCLLLLNQISIKSLGVTLTPVLSAIIFCLTTTLKCSVAVSYNQDTAFLLGYLLFLWPYFSS